MNISGVLLINCQSRDFDLPSSLYTLLKLDRPETSYVVERRTELQFGHFSLSDYTSIQNGDDNSNFGLLIERVHSVETILWGVNLSCRGRWKRTENYHLKMTLATCITPMVATARIY